MRTREEQNTMTFKGVLHEEIRDWLVPDPFVMNFPSGGSISFFKDGRIDFSIPDPDGAAKDMISYLELHYREHILEAERRAEQRVRAEIARDSERLDWLEGIVEAGFRVSPIGRGISGAAIHHGYGDISAATLRSAIDAAREAQ